MKHYLNVCDIKGSEVAPVDVITFGSPCQDLSLAGKRRGMHHSEMGDDDTTRSGLFMEAIRIIREMRESTQGKSPRYAVWENVYGALSSNDGADFQTVLTTLSNVKDPNIEIPMPLNNHWDSAGYVQGDSFSIAWRTLDAQYWGVPQRRRRIFMVADFDGNSAFDIMFNSEYDKSVVQGTNSYSDKDSTIGFDTYNIQLTGSVGKTLQAEGGGSGVNEGCMLVSPSNSSSICYGISSYDSNAFKSANPHSGIYVADTARTLDLNGGNPACNQGGICVCEPKPTEDLYCVDQGGGKSGCNVTNQTAPTLTTTHQGEPVICEPTTSISYGIDRGFGVNIFEECSPTIMAAAGESGNNQPMVATKDTNSITQTTEPKAYGMSSCTFFHVEEEGAPTLMARDYKDPTLTCYKTADPNHHYIVRRLTPLECCRLQGMPDGWTHLTEIDDMSDDDLRFWNNAIKTKAEIDGKFSKPKSKQQLIDWYNKLQTDSAEYKAYGNGMALPCVLVSITGIAQFGAKTMASLFDGIGGFPLAGRMNGIECLWTSEIELFPIAVTKQNFT